MVIAYSRSTIPSWSVIQNALTALLGYIANRVVIAMAGHIQVMG